MKLSLGHLCDFLNFCCQNSIASPLQERSQVWQSPHHTRAAVLIGIAPNEVGQWQILMTRRAETLRHHRGQIAFAGGKCELCDVVPITTALRETHEETGVAPEIWQVSGCLNECYTPSGFAITPVLAWTSRLPEIGFNPHEVVEVFWLPLDFALDLSCYDTRDGLPILLYLHYDIWGATALMLHHLAVCWVAWCDA